MPEVQVREGENFDLVLRRFKRACEKAGIISECRRHEFYEKPTWKRKRLSAQAKKRQQKRLSKSMPISARGLNKQGKVVKPRTDRNERTGRFN